MATAEPISLVTSAGQRARAFSGTGADGARVYLTAGAMTEDREGGTLPGHTVADGCAIVQGLRSERYDLGFNADLPLDSICTMQLSSHANGFCTQPAFALRPTSVREARRASLLHGSSRRP